MKEELLDLVDSEDNIIGQIYRSDAYERHIENIRAVHFLIQNSDGKFWIPRRSKNKTSYPLALDFSASGCVSSGEDYEQALFREVKEELNIDLTNTEYKFLKKFSPYKYSTRAFCKLYITFMNTVPNYNPEDFCGYFWLSKEEIISFIKSGESVKSDLLKIVDFL